MIKDHESYAALVALWGSAVIKTTGRRVIEYCVPPTTFPSTERGQGRG